MYPVETESTDLAFNWKSTIPIFNAFPTKTIMAKRADCAEMPLQSKKLSPLCLPNFFLWGRTAELGVEESSSNWAFCISWTVSSLDSWQVNQRWSQLPLPLPLRRRNRYICPVKSLWAQAATLWILFLQWNTNGCAPRAKAVNSPLLLAARL